MSILFGDKEVIVSTPNKTTGVSDNSDAPLVVKRERKGKRKNANKKEEVENAYGNLPLPEELV